MFRVATRKVVSPGAFNGANSAAAIQLRLQSTAVATIPDRADVVIIGGGTAGCNTLYQLAKRGINVVLLERAKVTAGTTWHTTGVLWRLRPTDVDMQLNTATRNLLLGLEAETGQDPGWTGNGGLHIAENKERLDEYRRWQTAGRSFGIESALLDPAETQKLFPLVDAGAIVGSLFSPGDGYIDPAMMCAALNKASRLNGGQIIEGCPVSGITTGQSALGAKQITGVVTAHGTIKTGCVVNCAGVWSREVAGLLGLCLPLLPMKHAYVVTEGVPGARGMPNVRAPDSSIYIRTQGEALCLGGYEPDPIAQDKVASDFNFSLYELDWDVFDTHMKGATKLLPAFKTAGIRTTVCGSESFTADHKPLMGPDPRQPGLFHGCAFNSAGMMLGGGCAEQLASWIVTGRPTLPMFAYDIRRFCPEQLSNERWNKERVHEAYAMNFSIPFPHDQPLAGRNLKLSPLHQTLVDAGAVMEQRDGWETPGWFLEAGTAPVPGYDSYGAYGTPRNTDTRYTDLLKGEYSFGFSRHHDVIGEEALACRERAALFDTSAFGRLFLSGPDAQQAADWLFSANTRMPVGSSVRSFLLGEGGGIEGDVTVTAADADAAAPGEPAFKGRGFHVTVNGSTAHHILAHIRTVVRQKAFRADVTDVADRTAVLSVQGPNSRSLLSDLVDADLGDDHFPALSSQRVSVAGAACRAFRGGLVGELGYELHVPRDAAPDVFNALSRRGRQHGLRNAGLRAFYSLTCENGFALWQSDVRPDDSPVEAGLAALCREDGDYAGKAALDAARAARPVKRRAFFRLREPVQLWGLEAVWRDGALVGYLRRGDYGYALGASIGIGYVGHHAGKLATADYLEAGSYEIEVMGKLHKADLHLTSPFDPLNKRPMGIYEDPIPVRRST